MRMAFVCLLVGWLGGSGLLAQTSVNPDISLVGDFRAYSHNDEERAEESEKLSLASPQLELNLNGYLNPYVRADAVVGWHGESNAEIEEAYATVLRGLPLNMNLRAGKYLLEFGHLNTVHEHAYSFLARPLPHEAFFGHHGLADMAVRSSFLLPTGEAFTELMGGLLKGDALVGGHDHEHEHEHEGETADEDSEDHRPDLGFFGRLATSLAVSQSAELALGATALNAVHEFHEEEHDENGGEENHEPEQMRAWVIGGDLKYKSVPSRYSTLQIEAETLVRLADHEDETLKSYGSYGYLDYRFRQRYNVGGIVEWVRVAEHELDEATQEESVHNHDTMRFGLFAGFAPVEETSLVRLVGHWTDPDEGDGFWEVTLQLVFSLGPHQPHNF